MEPYEVEPPAQPGYHFTVDNDEPGDRWYAAPNTALNDPGQAFFCLFRHGRSARAATTFPRKYIDRYKANSDQGCGMAYKRRKHVRATEYKWASSGQVPEVKPSDPRRFLPGIPDVDQKKLEARQMETFAGFASTLMADRTSGDAVQEMGVLDNTLFVYIVGDNGASAEADRKALTTK